MNTPSHETVAQRAYHLWEKQGCPDGHNTEIWLEAEKQLAAEEQGAKANSTGGASHGSNDSHKSNGGAVTAERIKAETAAESTVENHISPAIPDDEAIKAALQKREARAPIVPHTNAPKAKPPETGKPLWSKPHSS